MSLDCLTADPPERFFGHESLRRGAHRYQRIKDLSAICTFRILCLSNSQSEIIFPFPLFSPFLQSAIRNSQSEIIFCPPSSVFQIRNCPSDSHPSGGFPVSQSAIRNYLPFASNLKARRAAPPTSNSLLHAPCTWRMY